MSVGSLTNSPLNVLGAAKNDGSQRQENPRFKAGEILELTVVERLRNRHYRVLLANTPRLVSSTTDLTVGLRVKVQVATSAQRLVLRSVAAQEGSLTLQEVSSNDVIERSTVDALAIDHAVALDASQRSLIQEAAENAQQPLLMATAGIFLAKLGVPVADAAMRSIYNAQVWSSSPAKSLQRPVATSSEVDKLVELMADAFDVPSMNDINNESQAVPLSNAHLSDNNDGQSFADGERRLAREILNTPNDGSVAYRYGVLPLLIDNQLVELDLVCFRTPARSSQGELRRLVMTFTSPSLGRIEITAHAVGNQLSVNIRSASSQSNEVLSSHAADVRDLVQRLGWNVEALAYDSDPQVSKAATHLVEHVLRADTLSRLL